LTGKKFVLAIIVISQFFCTSVWFAGNSVVADIVKQLHAPANFLAHLTSAIQFGFITGTFIFAVLAIADRYSPSLVFFTSAVIASVFNLCITIPGLHTGGLLLFRFLTGIFLAGIYPVGMKIAADHFEKGLGRSLGFLVGALVVGTALPHLLRDLTLNISWLYVIYATSALCFCGGLCIFLFVPDGPYRKPRQAFSLFAFAKGFRNNQFRSAAFGYFGHMWELYTFWAFVPVMIAAYNLHYVAALLIVPLWSFIIIGCGSLACVFSGIIAEKYGAKKIAAISLFLSFLCCLLSPLLLLQASKILFLIFLILWGQFVIADSPLFSTLIASNAPGESRGSSLTIVNCIGFSITIASIQFISAMAGKTGPRYLYMLLAIGPLFGLISLGLKTNGK
jgi:MFS family permease